MANTYTTRLNLTKPEVGADTNAWGGHLNANLDTIDSNILSLSIATTQTMTGALALPSNGLNVGSGQLNVTGGNVSMSGNASAVNGTFSGTLAVTGASTLTGNTSVGGTLGVTGAATLSSTLSVTGATTLASNGLNVGSGQLQVTGGNVNMSGALTVTGACASGNKTVNGTLNVTGATTLASNGLNVGSGQLQVTGGNVTASGNITATGNVTAYSDARLKENVETISNALDLVNRMRGVFYDRIDTGEPGVGVIAQEMEEIIPEVVAPSDGKLTVAYGNLVGVLIEAVKELSAKIEALEAK